MRDNNYNEPTVSESPENRPHIMDEAQICALVDSVFANTLRLMHEGQAQAHTSTGKDGAGGGADLLPPSPWQVEPDYAKATQNFKWRMPIFEIGTQPFKQFRLDFQLSADQSGFKIPDDSHPRFAEILHKRGQALNGLFYQCLSTGAKALAGQ